MTQDFRSYGRCAIGTSAVPVPLPSTVTDIQQAFAEATANGQRVTIHGGGHSFDGQALQEGDHGADLVLVTDRFTDITFEAGDRVRVGAGATWSDILTQSLGRGLIPAVMQTGGASTAGGTLGGDCLSRFSGALGKESQWIESFWLVPPVGDCLECSRTVNSDLFYAAIGGLGYLGFVTDITYQLLRLPPGSCAHTDIDTAETLEELIGKLIPRTLEASRHASSFLSATGCSREAQTRRPGWTRVVSPNVRAVSSGAFQSGNEIKGVIFDSHYAAPANPSLPHFPFYHDLGSGLRYASELMARHDRANHLFDEAMFTLFKSPFYRTFDDNIPEFTFFMDGNKLAKERFEREHHGQPFPIMQQTFVVREERVVTFVNAVSAKLKAEQVTPTELDILYVLKDDCLLSATHDAPGFAVTLTFENYTTACPPAKVEAVLRELSATCQEAGGRIHLVKNLCADKDVVRGMLNTTIKAFEDIKKKLDPKGILRNGFSDRIFNF